MYFIGTCVQVRVLERTTSNWLPVGIDLSDSQSVGRVVSSKEYYAIFLSVMSFFGSYPRGRLGFLGSREFRNW